MIKHNIVYVSEFTRFMNAYLADHPEVAADQQRGHAIYWDKQVDLNELKIAAADTLPTDGYYYFGHPSPRTS